MPPLNPHQEQVAEHFETRALVIAGPGSGKTSTITARIGRLLRRNVLPAHILCITFTNKAAQEMKERIVKSYGGPNGAGSRIHICTFHALAIELLRKYGTALGYTPKITILDSEDQEDLMAQIARQKFAKNADVEITKPKIRSLLTITNDWRENLQSDQALVDKVDDGDITEEELSVIHEYLRRMKMHNQIDFSGLLSEAVRLLRTALPNVKPEDQLLAKLHRQYKFIQVDEYQDTNGAQNEIVELLAGESDNVLAVGDQDQSIYEWRGANPEGIARFVNNGRGKRGCKTFPLAINYRSTPEIIATADTLIRHSPKRIAIDFKAHNPSLGKPPKLEVFNTPEDEGRAVAEKVKALMTLRNVPPHGIAVFYRLNDMSRPIETALARLQIPYKVIGGLSFYDRTEIKDCISMLRVLCNPKDAAAFSRIINKPKRGIGEKTLGLIENFAIMRNIDLVKACSFAEEIFDGDPAMGDAVRRLYSIYGLSQTGKTPADCLAEVVASTDYHRHLLDNEKDNKPKVAERLACIQELINSIALYCQDHPDASIETYLQYVALLTSHDDTRNNDAVRLMSLHASKGLEFDCVFMVGVEQNLLPHKKAMDERPDVGLNEERRLCYVGFTRAKKQLFISYCHQRQSTFQRGRGVQFEARRPSQFLLESALRTQDQ